MGVVLEGGNGSTDDLPSCSHYMLQGLPAGCGAAAVPHSDAAGQDALGGPAVESRQDGMMETGALALLSLWRKWGHY